MREQRLDGSLGVHAEPHPELVLTRVANGVRRVLDRLQVTGHHVGSCRLEVVEEVLRRLDHQMAVQRKPGVWAKRLDHHRPDRERWHEVRIHDVDMDNVGMWLDRLDLVRQVREIGREDGSRQPAHGADSTGAVPTRR